MLSKDPRAVGSLMLFLPFLALHRSEIAIAAPDEVSGTDPEPARTADVASFIRLPVTSLTLPPATPGIRSGFERQYRRGYAFHARFPGAGLRSTERTEPRPVEEVRLAVGDARGEEGS